VTRLKEMEGWREILKGKTKEEARNFLMEERKRFRLSNEDIENILRSLEEQPATQEKEDIENILRSPEEQPVEFQGPPGERGPEGSQGPPGSQGPQGPPGPGGRVPRWIGAICITAVLIAIIALAVALVYHPVSTDFQQSLEVQNSRLQGLQRLIETQEKIIADLQTQIAQLKNNLTLLQQKLEKPNEDHVQEEIRKLQEQPSKLQEELNRIVNTDFESVNRYIRKTPLGWDPRQMAQDLEEKFWVETKIVTRENVQYLFLRFKCHCTITQEWWWVTYKGLLPTSEAPVQP